MLDAALYVLLPSLSLYISTTVAMAHVVRRCCWAAFGASPHRHSLAVLFFFWLYFLACSCFHCPLLLGLDPDRRVIATRFPFTVCFLFLLDAASGMAMLPGRLGFI